MIDGKLLATLRERVKGQVVLTTDDLRAVLPIETLSADDLAMIVLQLEDAGVSLEVTDDLLGTSRRRTPTSPQTPVFNCPGRKRQCEAQASPRRRRAGHQTPTRRRSPSAQMRQTLMGGNSSPPQAQLLASARSYFSIFRAEPGAV